MPRDIAPLTRALDDATRGEQRDVYGLLAAWDQSIETATNRGEWSRFQLPLLALTTVRQFLHGDQILVLSSRAEELRCALRVCPRPRYRLPGNTHKTAGYVDPRFSGNVTLEIYNMANEAVIFSRGGSSNCYDGKYQGQTGTTEQR